MGVDMGELRRLAAKGYLGHSALLSPDSFVSSIQPYAPGIQVAQNSTNEIGLEDRLKVAIPQEQIMPVAAPATSGGVRSKDQAKRNYDRLSQGMDPAEVSRLDALGQ